jgi:carotenoid cleavage dioxygenase
MHAQAATPAPAPAVGRGSWLLGFTGLIPLLLVVPFLLAGLWGLGIVVQLAATGVVIAYHLRRGQGVTSLDAFALVLGLANAVLYFGLGSAVLIEHLDATVYTLLLAQVAVSLVHGEPWTTQFARRTVPPAVWSTPQFRGANRTVTLAWGACFLACLLAALLGSGTVLRFLLPVALNVATAVATPRIVDWYMHRQRRPTMSQPQAPGVDTAGALFRTMPAGFNAAAAGDLRATYQFHLTDEQPADWYIRIAEGRCEVGPGVAEAPTITVTTAGETWLGLSSGRLDGPTAFMQGKLQVVGDISLLTRLGQLFAAPLAAAPSAAPAAPSAANPTVAPASPSPYLRGNFGPVDRELTAYDLPVDGAIPPELAGRYLRNGPNPTPLPVGPYHWFLGDGMVHGAELRAGRAVAYRNRWVVTERLAAKRELPPPAGPADVIPGGTAANVNVIQHGSYLLALGEAGLPYELTAELGTVGRFDYAGRLRSAMTAHPKVDPLSGELVFFGYSPFPPYLRYHVADAAGTLLRSEVLDLPRSSMMHDFAITARYAVFYDLPVRFDAELLGKGTMPFSWQPETGARVGVMPRGGGNADLRWLEIPPCFVFHTVNAFDDGDRVVMDVVRYAAVFQRDARFLGTAGSPALHRWTIDLAAGTFQDTVLDDRPLEFPRVDERLTGRPHRYSYGAAVHLTPDGVDFGGLLKHDGRDGTTRLHDFGPGQAAGEGVFVPASATAGEDEGWVLALVYDAARDASDLVILDATAFTAPPVATIHLPQRVPFGFHGNWIPAAAD